MLLALLGYDLDALLKTKNNNNTNPAFSEEVGLLIAPKLFRFFWKEHLDPVQGTDKLDRITRVILSAIVDFMITKDPQNMPKEIAGPMIEVLLYDDIYKLAGKSEMAKTQLIVEHDSFDEFIMKRLARTDDDVLRRSMLFVYDSWKKKIDGLSPSLIASVKTVNTEYIEWLSKHPSALDRIAWEAFEKLIGEVFARQIHN